MTDKEKNNNSYTQDNSIKKAQNDLGYDFSEGYIHDGKWITERGGSNNEPDETPNERPHTN